MIEKYDVFLCYSSRNRRFVNRLATDLTEHHVGVWIDAVEIEVGDRVHSKIEQGIERSRYFCPVLSLAWMQSYYASEVEFELAFTKMIREKRDSFILPLMWQKPDSKLPTRLEGIHYLDFTNPQKYTENVRRLVKRVRLHVDAFSGSRWYKAIEISPFGHIVGISELSQAAPTGPSAQVFYDKGVVTKVDIYQNRRMVNYKRFTFDDQGRVHENLMYEQDPKSGNWRYVDTWRYYYDPVTGRRIRKVIDKPGARSRRELYYDGHNHEIEELIVTLDGPPDISYGYSRKVFVWSPGGAIEKEIWFDLDGKEIPRRER